MADSEENKVSVAPYGKPRSFPARGGSRNLARTNAVGEDGALGITIDGAAAPSATVPGADTETETVVVAEVVPSSVLPSPTASTEALPVPGVKPAAEVAPSVDEGGAIEI